MQFSDVRLTFIASLFALFVSQASNAAVLIDGPEVDLTTEDMDQIMLVIPEENKKTILADFTELRRVMDSTYLAKALAAKAESLGLDKDPAVEAGIWHKKLNLMTAAYLDRKIDEALAQSDFAKAAHEEYLSNPDKYKTQPSAEVSHVLLARTLGREGAEEIRKRILSNELTLEEAAQQYSQDKASSDRGGKLGRIKPGDTVEPFDQMVFHVMKEEGEISPIVDSQFGFHIIRLDHLYPAEQKTFDEVKEEIAEDMRKKRRARLREDVLIEVRDDPDTRAIEDEMKKYHTSQGQ